MGSEFLTYLRLGFAHIADLAGYDHVLFVAALTGGYALSAWRRLLWLVTAFTLGHTATLALATLRLVTLDAALVEALIPATILMPADAPASKHAATEGYGAEVITFDRYAEDREALVAALAAERGLTIVHPYDEPLVMAGAGTAGLELVASISPALARVMPSSSASTRANITKRTMSNHWSSPWRTEGA